MIAFDTNYLVRHIIQDDASQTRCVREVLNGEIARKQSILLLNLVLVETCWVLASCYGVERKAWMAILQALLDDKAFRFENRKTVEQALVRLRKGKADFADYMISESASEHGCRLETFDRNLGRG